MKFSAEKTRQLIVQQQLTQDALSKLANMPLVTICNALNGKRQPKLKTLGRIAAALGVPVTEIIDQEVIPVETA